MSDIFQIITYARYIPGIYLHAKSYDFIGFNACTHSIGRRIGILKLAKKKDNPFWSYSAEIIVAGYVWHMIDLEWNMSAICGIYI